MNAKPKTELNISAFGFASTGPYSRFMKNLRCLTKQESQFQEESTAAALQIHSQKEHFTCKANVAGCGLTQAKGMTLSLNDLL